MNRIKNIRNSKKISLAKLSDSLKKDYDINVSPQTLMRYEKEETQPKMDTFEAIADFFNVPVGFLLGLTSDLKEDRYSGFDDVVKEPLVAFEKAFPDKLSADMDIKIAYGELLLDLKDSIPNYKLPGINKEPDYNANSFAMESIRTMISLIGKHSSIEEAKESTKSVISDFQNLVDNNK